MPKAKSEGISCPAFASPLVDTAWLDGHLGEPDLRILDCSVVMKSTGNGGYTFVSGREEWEQGHIPGSVFVDVLRDLGAEGDPRPMMMPRPEEFADTMAALGVGERTRVVQAIAGHADDVSFALKRLDQVKLVFGKYAGEGVITFRRLGCAVVQIRDGADAVADVYLCCKNFCADDPAGRP